MVGRCMFCPNIKRSIFNLNAYIAITSSCNNPSLVFPSINYSIDYATSIIAILRCNICPIFASFGVLGVNNHFHISDDIKQCFWETRFMSMMWGN